MRILLTEDNVELADITAFNLKKDGFAVDRAYTGEEALGLLEDGDVYDVIILDLNLPDIDGIELLKDLKSIAPNVPVLALTARDTVKDRINGLKKGLDDYLVKPFSHRELVARLRVLYRSHQVGNPKIIKVGDLQINPQSQSVFRNGKVIRLTLNEFRVLYYLAENRGKLVLTKELLVSVWDMNSDGKKAKLFTTISRLRKKLGDHNQKIIRTQDGHYAINL